VAAAEPSAIPPHGAELRGLDLVTQSPTAEGRFGFMFKSQPPHGASADLLTPLGQAMKEQPAIDPATGITKDDNDRFNENPSATLTSGFTFVGQFVDHDITFDRTPVDQVESDPYATKNFRSPRYDLDAVYGEGPTVDTQLYNSADRDKFQIETRGYTSIGTIKTAQEYVYDVPRAAYDPNDPIRKAKAAIADPRNDQTLIILQLHVAMQMFHNKLVDYMRKIGVPRASVFESARRLARWHYQWMVTHEFLPAIVGDATAKSVYEEVPTGAPKINIKFYRPTNSEQRPFIPVEFSVAAYRFGHSITRPRYTVRDIKDSTGKVAGTVSSVPLFEAGPTENNLNGGRLVPPRLKMQWSKFFNDPGVSPKTARPVRQFDASLGDPLSSLPSSALPDTVIKENSLAVRNLHRGKLVGLPSGQQVAQLMGETPLTDDELSQNHRIEIEWPIVDNNVIAKRRFTEDNPSVATALSNMGGEAPLWFYILKEAEVRGRGETLGPVGGRIVAEVLVGLLQRDLNSYLYLQPTWKPGPPVTPVRGRCNMSDILKFAGVWS